MLLGSFIHILPAACAPRAPGPAQGGPKAAAKTHGAATLPRIQEQPQAPSRENPASEA